MSWRIEKNVTRLWKYHHNKKFSLASIYGHSSETALYLVLSCWSHFKTLFRYSVNKIARNEAYSSWNFRKLSQLRTIVFFIHTFLYINYKELGKIFHTNNETNYLNICTMNGIVQKHKTDKPNECKTELLSRIAWNET